MLSSLSLNNSHTPCCSANTPSPTLDEVQTHPTLITKSSEDTLHAKLKELNDCKKEQVYISEKDEGQDCISLRWVLKEMLVDCNKIIQARLCACGFEEAQDLRRDSPTSFREGLHLATAMITSNNTCDSPIFLPNLIEELTKSLKTNQHHCSYRQPIPLWNYEDHKSNIRLSPQSGNLCVERNVQQWWDINQPSQ